MTDFKADFKTADIILNVCNVAVENTTSPLYLSLPFPACLYLDSLSYLGHTAEKFWSAKGAIRRCWKQEKLQLG